MNTKVGYGQKVGDGSPMENQQPYDPETGKFSTGVSPDSERTKENFGYHAGDLGKDEFYKAMGGRNTGHFGTGTYFVGDEAILGNYNARDGIPAPHHKVSFDGYNLYKPQSDEDASRLYEALGGLNSKDFEMLANEEYMSAVESLAKAKEYFEGFSWRLDNDIPEEGEERNALIDSVNNLIDYYNKKESKVTSLFYLEPHLLERIPYDADSDDLAVKITDSMREIMRKTSEFGKAEKYTENVENTKRRLGRIFGDDAVEKALDETIKKARSYESQGGRDNPESAQWDSLSTVFMKALGYEGIDTRGLPSFDNVNYGSVIYDLKS